MTESAEKNFPAYSHLPLVKRGSLIFWVDEMALEQTQLLAK